MPSQLKIGIVGGGLVGACCAYALCREGHEVVLFEPGEIGGATSFGNAGIMSSGGCVPFATPGIIWKVPGMLLDRAGPLSLHPMYLPAIAPRLIRMLWYSRRGEVERISAALASLLTRAQAAYQDLLEVEEYSRMIQARGLLFPYKSEAAFQAGGFARDLRQKHGVAFEILNKKELQSLEPSLSGDHRRAVYYRDARHSADPRALARHFCAQVESRGGAVAKETVLRIDPARNRGAAVVSESGRREFDRVVISAGAWSGRLAKSCEVRVPLDAERGYHVSLPKAEVPVRGPIISGDHNIAISPMADGLRVSGIVELAGLRTPPNHAHSRRILGVAEQLLPGLRTHGASFWMGCRPSLPDSLPVIGTAPRNRNIVCAFGHGHLGVTYAAVTGQLVADLVAERRPSIDLTPFRPERFW